MTTAEPDAKMMTNPAASSSEEPSAASSSAAQAIPSAIPAQEQQVVNLELASIVDLKKIEKHRITTIDTGPIDFVLKCTDGLFKGRFIYVNRTSQGELFGSDTNQTARTNSAELSWLAALSVRFVWLTVRQRTRRFSKTNALPNVRTIIYGYRSHPNSGIW